MSISSIENFYEIAIEHGKLIEDHFARLITTPDMTNTRTCDWYFSLSEAAYFLGVTASHLKKLHLAGRGPSPETSLTGRRKYTAGQLNEMRQYMIENGRGDPIKYDPSRRGDEKLQIISVVSTDESIGKVTTTAHLAQHLALKGHRVLVIDIDPKLSISNMLLGYDQLGRNAVECGTNKHLSEDNVSAAIKNTSIPHLKIMSGIFDTDKFELGYSSILKQESLIDSTFDIVLFNCPSCFDNLVLNALSVSTGVLVPVSAGLDNIFVTSRFLSQLGEIWSELGSSNINADLDWVRYLITGFDKDDNSHQQIMGMMNMLLPQHLLKTALPKSKVISFAAAEAKTLFGLGRHEFEPKTYDHALTSIRHVNEEITDTIHQSWSRNKNS